MKLRQRVALTILGFGLPLVFGVDLLRRDTERRLEVEGLVNLALGHMDAGARAACEEAPSRFGGPLRSLTGPPAGRDGDGRRNGPIGSRRGDGRGRPPPQGRGPERARRGPAGDPRLWAFDAQLVCANPTAPPLPAEFRAALTSGEDVVYRRIERGDLAGLEVAFRTEWTDGPCAVLWITHMDRPGAPRTAGSSPTPILLGAALALGLLLAALCAAWPLVRRIRGLTRAVEATAASGYSTPVPVSGRDELTELAEAFNSARAEIRARMVSLQERAAALRAFLANTTHDVMTPLTVLQGHLGAIQRKMRAGEEPSPEALRACQEEAHYMASLLHNLTAVARLESGALAVARDPLDLRQIVERAAARHRPMAASRGLGVEIAVPDSPVRVLGDVTLLEQAVSNLVHNAVRHNVTGAHVAVVLDAEDERFVLRIVDDGPGVDEAALARLGGRRFRTDEARQRAPDGQGLGLHIAQEAAAAHGFELSFHSPVEGADETQRGFEARMAGPQGNFDTGIAGLPAPP